jgi:hypothetical protein
MKALIIVVCVMLAGCAQEIANRDNAACAGRPDYKNCRLAMQQERNAKIDIFARAVAGYNPTVCHQVKNADGSLVTYCSQPTVDDVSWWR